MHLKIQPLTPETLSFYGNHNYNLQGDCGYDLGLAKDTKVYFKATTKINLQVIIVGWETISDCDFTGQSFEDQLPCDFLIVPRSSISKTALRLANAIGTIDKNYRGSLIVALDYLDLRTEQQLPLLTELETGFQYSILQKGTRLVQIIAPVFRQIDSTQIVSEHDTTERGDGSFGSTDKIYTPDEIRVGSKTVMSHVERTAYLKNSELGKLYGFPQNDEKVYKPEDISLPYVERQEQIRKLLGK